MKHELVRSVAGKSRTSLCLVREVATLAGDQARISVEKDSEWSSKGKLPSGVSPADGAIKNKAETGVTKEIWNELALKRGKTIDQSLLSTN